jgi:Bacterial extracellular solute-binding protein
MATVVCLGSGDAPLRARRQSHALQNHTGIRAGSRLPLPSDLGLTTLFSAVVMDGTKSADTAKALIDFLRMPEAATVIKAHGLAPAFP